MIIIIFSLYKLNAEMQRAFVPYTNYKKAKTGFRKAPARKRLVVRKNTLRGKGGYFSDVWGRATNYSKAMAHQGLIPGAGRAIGDAVSKATGIPFLGEAGNWLGKVTGLGNYKIKKNTFLSPDPPVVSNHNNGTRIQHREYIADIVSSTAFSNSTLYPINPAQATTFPWLSTIASNYTQYKFHGLIFEFITTSGNSVSSANTALGEICMATNYNSIDAAFTSKQAMLNEEFSTSGVPSCNLMHPVECANRLTSIDKLYTRDGAVPTNSDQRLYDLGQFQIATQGSQGAYTVGELYCSYDIELFKPQLVGNASGNEALAAHYQLTGVTNALPFGTANIQKFDTIGLTISTATASTIQFPIGSAGLYLVTYQVSGTSAITVAPAYTYTNSIGGPALFISETNPYVNDGGAHFTTYNGSFVVKVNNNSLTALWGMDGSGTLPTAMTSADIVVCQLPSNVA